MELYPKLLQVGKIEVEDWVQPSTIVLTPIANAITTIFPLDSNIDKVKIEDNTTLVGNDQIFIGTLTIMSHVYLKTGKLPRPLISSSNFKIVGWKQFVEYFGCIDQSLDFQQEFVVLKFGEINRVKVVGKCLEFENRGANEMWTCYGELPVINLSIMVPTNFQHQKLTFVGDAELEE